MKINQFFTLTDNTVVLISKMTTFAIIAIDFNNNSRAFNYGLVELLENKDNHHYLGDMQIDHISTDNEIMTEKLKYNMVDNWRKILNEIIIEQMEIAYSSNPNLFNNHHTIAINGTLFDVIKPIGIKLQLKLDDNMPYDTVSLIGDKTQNIKFHFQTK